MRLNRMIQAIPAGSKIKSMAWYDNSATNKSNPDATKDVKWGDQSWEAPGDGAAGSARRRP